MAPETRRTIEAIVGILFLMTIPVAILVHNFNNLPSGYVAPYLTLCVWGLAFLASILAVIFLAIPRTRPLGFGFAAAIVFIPFAFFVGVKVSDMAGLTHWRNRPMVHLGPDVSYNVVVYYKLGTTRTQIEELEDSVIYMAPQDSQRRHLKPGITAYFSLQPSQAHGHDGFAIQFASTLPEAQRESVIAHLTQSPVALNVWTDIAPLSIPDPEPKSPGSKN